MVESLTHHTRAAAQSGKKTDDGSLAASLLKASEANDPSEVEDLIDDAVVHCSRMLKSALNAPMFMVKVQPARRLPRVHPPV